MQFVPTVYGLLIVGIDLAGNRSRAGARDITQRRVQLQSRPAKDVLEPRHQFEKRRYRGYSRYTHARIAIPDSP